MKKTVAIIIGGILLCTAIVFSGVFNVNFGLIRGLRAKELLEANEGMKKGFAEVTMPLGKQVAEIQAKYNMQISNQMALRDEARNRYFDVPKSERATSEQARQQKIAYYKAAYNIAILESQRDLEASTINVDRYTKGLAIRLSNL